MSIDCLRLFKSEELVAVAVAVVVVTIGWNIEFAAFVDSLILISYQFLLENLKNEFLVVK